MKTTTLVYILNCRYFLGLVLSVSHEVESETHEGYTRRRKSSGVRRLKWSVIIRNVVELFIVAPLGFVVISRMCV